MSTPLFTWERLTLDCYLSFPRDAPRELKPEVRGTKGPPAGALCLVVEGNKDFHPLMPKLSVASILNKKSLRPRVGITGRTQETVKDISPHFYS
jgi:hypothetical protein